MPAKPFIDSSILLYLLDTSDLRKKGIAFEILSGRGFVSPQVLFECITVAVRKLKRSKQDAVAFASYIMRSSDLTQEDEQVAITGLKLFAGYMFQPFDSKIAATALVAGCTTLYSEDMQDGLLIENQLRIVNPFK